MKHPPPNKKGRARARSPNSPRSSFPLKPGEPAGTTKDYQQQRCQWLRCHWHLLLQIYKLFSHDIKLLAMGMMWIVLKFREEIIQIGLLLLAMCLQQ
jgi:hypothetical protein